MPEKESKYKIKKHKDFVFLLDLKSQKLSHDCTKYLIMDGKAEQIISDIKVPITVYFSYTKYDYSGKWIAKVDHQSMNLSAADFEDPEKLKGLTKAVSSMKVGEKSWFNFQGDTSVKENQQLSLGFHYDLTLEKIKYKNDNTVISKKLVYEDNRAEGKAKFQQKKFKQAFQYYRDSINILKGLSKKFFTQKEIEELTELRLKSERNLLKCVAKMQGCGGRWDKKISEFAKAIAENLLKEKPNQVETYYLHAGYLKYICRYSDSFDAVNEGLKILQNEEKNLNEGQLNSQKSSLATMKGEIKRSKERHLRHLEREAIREKKNTRAINQMSWEDEDLM